MSLPFGLWMCPVALLMLPLLIPVIYGLKWGRKKLKDILLISLCSLGVVVCYPLVHIIETSEPTFGYAIGKALVFVLLPLVTVLFIERKGIRNAFLDIGVRWKGMPKSMAYGLLAAAVTISITVLISTTYPWIPLNQVIMFLEAFTEEAFFRGFLFLYLLRKTNLKVAYPTSVLAFILAHPHLLTNIYFMNLAAQAVLLPIVAHKTKNITGTWLAHGLNRVLPVIVRNLLGI